MLGVRLDAELENRLKNLAQKTERSKSFLVKKALVRYIEEEERKQQENELALSRWEAYQETGDNVSNDSMMEWLESWGTGQAKQCPVK